MPNYDYFHDGRLPPYMEDATRRWIERGEIVGDFLTAAINNDLHAALAHADENNRDALWEWCRFFYNEAPNGSHGSPEKAKAWREQGGLEGIEAAA